MPSQNEAGANTELAIRVKSILASKQLTLHQASGKSASLFGQGSSYYLPHNIYYDISRGHFSPSLFQLLAFSQISNYRLRDWLRVFGFDVEAIPRLQMQLPSRRTALLESSLDDPNSRIPWFRNLGSRTPPVGLIPLSQLLVQTEPHRLGSFSEADDKHVFYARIGSEDAMAFPELLPGSVVRVNARVVDRVLRQITAEGSAHLVLIQHATGLSCSHVRLGGRGRIATISTQLPYAQMEFRVPEEARILGVVDLEIRSLVEPRLPSVAKNLAKRWKPEVLTPEPTQLGPLLRRARLQIGLSLRAASAMSREVANTLGDERYFTASGSLSDYEALNTPPRHFHKILSFCAVYSLGLNAILQTLGLRLEDAGREPMPDLLTHALSSTVAGATAKVEWPEHTGFIRELVTELGSIPFFLRGSLTTLCGLRKPSLKDVFWIGRTPSTPHPLLAGGVLAVVNRQKKKPNDCGSKHLWQQPLYVVLKRDGTYICGCCSRENTSLVIHTYPGGVHKQEQLRSRDAEVIGKIVSVVRKL